MERERKSYLGLKRSLETPLQARDQNVLRCPECRSDKVGENLKGVKKAGSIGPGTAALGGLMAANALSGAGATIGMVGGPPGMIAGALIGGGLGYLLGKGKRKEAIHLSDNDAQSMSKYQCTNCQHCFNT